MALNNKIHEDDVGVIFRLTVQDCDSNGDAVAVDISSQTSMFFYFRSPQTDTVLTRTPSFTTDGTNGQIEYTSQAGDLDEDGRWALQARVIIAAGDFRTSIVQFPVEANIA